MDFSDGVEEIKRFSDQEKMDIMAWTSPPKALFYPGTGRDIARVLRKYAGLVDRFYFNDIGELFPDLFVELQDTQYFSALLEDPLITFYPGSGKLTRAGGIEYLDYALRYEERKIRFRFYHCDHIDAMKHLRRNKVKIDFLVLRGYGGEGGSNFDQVFYDRYEKIGPRMVKTYYENIKGYGIGPERIFIGGWELFRSICNPKLVVDRDYGPLLQETRELKC